MSRLPLRVRLTSSDQPLGGRSQEEEEPCPQVLEYQNQNQGRECPVCSWD